MDIKIIKADDWQGLFIDGKLSYEGHRLSAEDIMKCLGIKFAYKHVNQEWIEEQGSFPVDINDIPDNMYE